MRHFRCKEHPRYEGLGNPQIRVCLACRLLWFVRHDLDNAVAEKLFAPWMKFIKSKPYREED